MIKPVSIKSVGPESAHIVNAVIFYSYFLLNNLVMITLTSVMTSGLNKINGSINKELFHLVLNNVLFRF